MIEVSNSIKTLREDNNVTIEALAEVTGMHSMVIEAIENGSITPERVQVQKLTNGIVELIQ